MNTNHHAARARRGRAAQQKSTSPLRAFYIALAVVAMLGTGLIATQLVPKNTVTVDAGDVSTYPTKGQPNAPVTVIEYADFQCPGCATFATTLEPQLAKTYIDTGKMRFVYHEFPLTSIHANALISAEAGRCAADQGKFWAMHDLLFANQRAWESMRDPQQAFVAYAQAAGLDTAAFSQCLSSGTHRETMKAAEADAIAANITQTPTFVINGKQYNPSNLQQGIEDALAGR